MYLLLNRLFRLGVSINDSTGSAYIPSIDFIYPTITAVTMVGKFNYAFLDFSFKFKNNNFVRLKCSLIFQKFTIQWIFPNEILKYLSMLEIKFWFRSKTAIKFHKNRDISEYQRVDALAYATYEG